MIDHRDKQIIDISLDKSKHSNDLASTATPTAHANITDVELT